MKFLFASDSFKGTLSSERITQLLEAAHISGLRDSGGSCG